MLQGVDLYSLRMDRVLNVLQQLWVDEIVVEKEVWEARKNVRNKLDAQVLRVPQRNFASVDPARTAQDEPKPMIEPTLEVDGPTPFPGLDPPLGE